MEHNQVIEASKQYPLAFKNCALSLIDKFFTKNASKTGFMYNYESDKWMDISTVEIPEIKDWVKTYNANNIMPDSEPKIQVLDIQDKIAVVKVELDWALNRKGCDYIFLVKEKTWLIDKILWQSIL